MAREGGMLTKWTRLVVVAVLFVALGCWLQGQRSGMNFPCPQQASPAAAHPGVPGRRVLHSPCKHFPVVYAPRSCSSR